MQYLKTYFCILSFLFLIAYPLHAKTPSPSEFDPKTVSTFNGNVVSVQKFTYVTRPVPYIQFILQTDSGEYVVEVGPEWILEVNGTLLVPREEVEVIGSVIERGNTKIIVASQIKKGNIRIKLRANDGSPLWGGQRNLSY